MSAVFDYLFRSAFAFRYTECENNSKKKKKQDKQRSIWPRKYPDLKTKSAVSWAQNIINSCAYTHTSTTASRIPPAKTANRNDQNTLMSQEDVFVVSTTARGWTSSAFLCVDPVERENGTTHAETIAATHSEMSHTLIASSKSATFRPWLVFVWSIFKQSFQWLGRGNGGRRWVEKRVGEGEEELVS